MPDGDVTADDDATADAVAHAVFDASLDALALEVPVTDPDGDEDALEDALGDGEPVADAFMVEPLPYRSAVADGATHVIVLRTRPDPCPVLGKVRYVALAWWLTGRTPGGDALL